MRNFKKKSKRIVVCGLLALACTFSLGAVACSDPEPSETPVGIVEFEDATIGVGYNTDFSLSHYITGVDEKGTPHLGTAKVFDSEGNEVTLFENRFTVTDLKGYTVKVTIELEGKTYEKTLTLAVEDHSLPVITMAGMRQGEVGVEYVIPSIRITKDFDETEIIPTVKVYCESGSAVEELKVVDGKFTPTKKGEHRIEVTAVDKFGGKRTHEESFIVRSKMAENMLEDFDDEEYSVLSAMPQQKTYGQEVAWLDSYEGASGVVKTKTSSGYTPQYGMSKLALKTGRTRDELLEMDFDYINIRAYIDKEGSLVIGSKDHRFATVEGQEWVDIQLTKADITNNVLYNNSLYVDKAPSAPYEKFAEMHSANGSGDYLFYVTLKGEIPNGYANWNEYKADAAVYDAATKATQGVDIYIDYISYVKYTFSESAEMVKNQPFTIPTLTMGGFGCEAMPIADKTSVRVLWNGTTPVEVTNGRFTPTETGIYAIEYTVQYGGATYKTIKSFSIPRTIPDGYLDDFGEAACTGSVYVGNAAQKVEKAGEWLTEYTVGSSETKTRQGVLKVALPKSGNNYLWYSLPQTVAQLEAMNIKDITINYAVEREDGGLPPSGWCAMHMDTNTNVSVGINSGNWRTTTITLEKLKSIARYQKADGSMDWTALSCEGSDSWFLRSAATDNITLYFDSITYTTNTAE